MGTLLPDLSCDLAALSPAERKRQMATSVRLLARERAELVELEQGFELGFTPDAGRLVELARWVERESICCAWMTFAIVRTPSGLIRLRLTAEGESGKEAIRAGLNAVRAVSEGATLPPLFTEPTRPLRPRDFAEIGKAARGQGTCGCAPGACS